MIRTKQEIAVELLATGLSQHQLALLVELLASLPSRDERDVSRDARVMAAERARRYRAKNKDKSGMAGQIDAATTSRDERDANRDGALILSSSASFETGEFEKGRKEESKKETRAKRKPAVPLPSDWQPKPAHFAKAKALGRPNGFVESKAEDLRIWAESNDARKQNWDATFHGFIRRDNGVTNGKTRERGGSVIAAADTLLARINELNKPAPSFDRPGDGTIRDGEGARVVRLLPKG